MFRWAEADYDTRIARLERTIVLLALLLGLAIITLGVTAWNDVTQASTERSLAETESSLVIIAADKRKIDTSQNDSIGYLIKSDQSQNDSIKLLKPRSRH